MVIKVIDFSQDSVQFEPRRLTELPDRVVADDPHHKSKTYFKNDAGDVIAGTWTSTPGKWHAFTDRDEFFYIVSGHVRLHADDGSAQTFKTGDAFLIPNGFRGHLDVIATITKHFGLEATRLDECMAPARTEA